MNDDSIKKALHRIDVEKVKLKRDLMFCKPERLSYLLEGSYSREKRRAYNFRLQKLFAMEDALKNFQEIGNIDEDKPLFGSMINDDIRAVETLDTIYYARTNIEGEYAVKGSDINWRSCTNRP